MTSSANLAELSIEVIVGRYTFAKEPQSNASYTSFIPPTQPSRASLDLALVFLLPHSSTAAASSSRHNLWLECVFHRRIVTRHTHTRLFVSSGNFPWNWRSSTFTPGAFPNVNKLSRCLCHWISRVVLTFINNSNIQRKGFSWSSKIVKKRVYSRFNFPKGLRFNQVLVSPLYR